MKTRTIAIVETEQLFVWGRRLAAGLVVVGVAYTLMLTLLQLRHFFADSPDAATVAAGDGTPVWPSASEDTLQDPTGTTRISPSASTPRPSLELVGILAVGEEHGLVLIASDGQERVFSVGDALPDGTTLRAVFLDKVLLESSRGLETLRLPKNRPAAADERPADIPDPLDEPSGLPQSLVDYRDSFLSAPGAGSTAADSFEASDLAQYFIPAVAPSGELTGYRLSPSSREPTYEQLGLRPDDVITAVNGIPLTQPGNTVRGLRRLRSEGLASVTIIRDGNKMIDITLLRDESRSGSE